MCQDHFEPSRLLGCSNPARISEQRGEKVRETLICSHCNDSTCSIYPKIEPRYTVCKWHIPSNASNLGSWNTSLVCNQGPLFHDPR